VLSKLRHLLSTIVRFKNRFLVFHLSLSAAEGKSRRQRPVTSRHGVSVQVRGCVPASHAANRSTMPRGAEKRRGSMDAAGVFAAFARVLCVLLRRITKRVLCACAPAIPIRALSTPRPPRADTVG
jgi:hypothetical protein